MTQTWAAAPLWPLWVSLAMCCFATALAPFRLWLWSRRMPAGHANTRTALWFVAGFAVATSLWLGYGLYMGYGRFFQGDWERQWLLHSQALWTLPMFIASITWGGSWAVMWVLRSLQREAQATPQQ